MFNRTIRLPFKLLGIPLRLDRSFLVILPLLALMIGSRIADLAGGLGLPEAQAARLEGNGTAYLLGLLAAVGLFAGVVLHELGHAVIAQGYGVRVRSITLWLLGGVAEFDEVPRDRGAEAIIAMVGPFVSLTLAGLCWLALGATSPDFAAGRFLLTYLTHLNVVIAVFNMMPALPLDGGRVMRSLLALWLPFARATQVAGSISKVFAVLVGAVGLLSFNVFLLLIAVFIFFAVSTETGAVQMEDFLRDVPVRRVMNPRVSTARPEMRVADLADLAWRERHTTFPVVGDDGLVRGMISVAQGEDVDPSTPIAQVMSRDVRVARVDADTGEVVRTMLRDGQLGAVVVTDQAGRLAGIVTKTDLLRALQLRSTGREAVRRAEAEAAAHTVVPGAPAAGENRPPAVRASALGSA